MRHILIINPNAGNGSGTTRLMEMSRALHQRHGLDSSYILTQRPGHAAETCRAIAETGEAVRFYACGGDGTLNEVANGILGLSNAAMTCIPVGTGNDFLKNFGAEMTEQFRDIENLWNGPQFPLDVIDCNGRAALTIACSGFDARVARDVHIFGNSKLLPGRGSYVASLVANFAIRGLSQRWRVTIDGVEQPEKEYVLIAACNGRYYGGGFFPVPEARMDDGIMHTMIVRKVSRATFLRFVGAYSTGRYRKAPKVARCVTASEIRIDALEEDIVTCLDGEAVANRSVTLRLSGQKVNFFGPAGCDPNATAWADPSPDLL